MRTVPLPGLTVKVAEEQLDRLSAASRTAGTRDLEPPEYQSAQHEIRSVLAWLWDAVVEPILAHLGYTSAPRDGVPWPRLWWCPVGALAFLPLHAAGHYNFVDDSPRTALDRVVSSYTPTVRALAHARARSRWC